MKSHLNHILFITPAFPESEGQNNSVVYFSNFVSAYQLAFPEDQISVISVQLPESSQSYKWNGVSIYPLATFGKSKFAKLISWRKAQKIATKIHRKSEISIVHSLWLKECTLIGSAISKLLNINQISTIMGMELERRNKFLSFINVKNLKLVAVSDRLKTSASDKYKKLLDIDVIPWGIPEKRDFNRLERKIDLLFVGFLNENKNLLLFTEIVQSLKIKFPKIKTVVIGDYFNIDKWITRVEEMNLAGQIDFYGLKPNEMVLETMRQSKILVHTAHFEAQGYAMLEALSQGMYVVSKPIGIAKASAHWKICETQTEFETSIENILKDYSEPGIDIPYPIKNTVEAYHDLYSIHSKNKNG